MPKRKEKKRKMSISRVCNADVEMRTVARRI
jgi:hypothetical protein